MFRLKSFSEKLQPIEESLTKKQVDDVFSNDNFKIGIEFEFYNQSFLEHVGMPSGEETLILTKFNKVLKGVRKRNKEIILLRWAKKENQNSDKYKFVTEKDVLNDFETKDRDTLLFYFHRQGFKRKDLENLIYFFIIEFLTDMTPSGFENIFGLKYFTSTKHFKKDIFEKYKSNRRDYTKFMQVLAKTAQEPKFSDVRNFYIQSAELPKCVGTPIVSKSETKGSQSKWMVKLDPSVHPIFGGVELISPPMKVSEVIKVTKDVFDYIDKNGNTDSHVHDMEDSDETDKKSAQCGLHINISFSPERMKHFDPVKFVLFSNESQVDNRKIFGGRKDASYIDGVLKRMKSKFKNLNPGDKTKTFNKYIEDNMRKTLTSMDLMLMSSWGSATADKYSNINLTHVQLHRRVVRKKDERIEIRFFGGENYHQKFDLFKRVLSELLYAMDVATDPEKEKQKYMKKVFRIVNLINKSD